MEEHGRPDIEDIELIWARQAEEERAAKSAMKYDLAILIGVMVVIITITLISFFG